MFNKSFKSQSYWTCQDKLFNMSSGLPIKKLRQSSVLDYQGPGGKRTKTVATGNIFIPLVYKLTYLVSEWKDRAASSP